MKANAPAARRPRSVWVLATVFILGAGAFAALSRLDGVTFDPAESLLFGLAALLFTGLGGLILVRVPGNRIGWVISLAGLALLGSGIAGVLSDLGVTAARGISGALWTSSFALLGFLMLWFPTGQPPTRRWLWAEWLGFLMMGISIFLSLFSEVVCEYAEGGRCLTFVANPIGIAGLPDIEYQAPVIFSLFLFFVAGSAVSLIVRFVRSRGVERLQLKWFTYAVAMLVGWIVVEAMAEEAGFAYGNNWAAGLAFGLLFLGVPVSAVAAVLRFRLYDIDRVISRTVSYALVIGFLGAIYLGTVTVLAQTLPVQSDLAVVGATLSVVALFAPFRRRVQSAVDRRFNRTRYIADQEMAAFAHRVRDSTDLVVIEDDVRSVIDRTLQPVATNIWFGSDGA